MLIVGLILRGGGLWIAVAGIVIFLIGLFWTSRGGKPPGQPTQGRLLARPLHQLRTTPAKSLAPLLPSQSLSSRGAHAHCAPPLRRAHRRCLPRDGAAYPQPDRVPSPRPANNARRRAAGRTTLTLDQPASTRASHGSSHHATAPTRAAAAKRTGAAPGGRRGRRRRPPTDAHPGRRNHPRRSRARLSTRARALLPPGARRRPRPPRLRHRTGARRRPLSRRHLPSARLRSRNPRLHLHRPANASPASSPPTASPTSDSTSAALPTTTPTRPSPEFPATARPQTSPP